MSIDVLLSRLNGVRENGADKYMARCPAHEDRSPSLAVKECDDGRVLIHCFAGCETQDVLDAVGLTFGDLMPEQIGIDHSQENESLGRVRWINAKDALNTLDHESLVVSIIGADFLEHKNIDEESWSRLAIAVNRINSTRAVYAPARISR